MAETRRVFVSLQAFRGIASLMVVATHVTGFAGIQPGLWVHPTIGYSFLGMNLGVQLFFVLSGIVILSAHWDDISRPSRLRSYTWKRFRRIYPIYWIFLTLTVGKHLLAPDAAIIHPHQLFVLLSSYLLIHIHSIDVELGASWTLFHEILFYAVFAAFILNRKLGFAVLVSWLIASFLFLHVQEETYWGIFFSPLHLLFVFGMIVALLLRRDKVPLPLPILIVGCSVFVMSIWLVAHQRYISTLVDLTSGVGAMLMLLGAAELERRGHFAVPRWLSFLGDASYSMYLANFMVVSTSARIFYRLDQRHHLPIAVWMALMATLAIVVGCLSYVGIERPILKLMGRPAKPTMKVAAPAAA